MDRMSWHVQYTHINRTFHDKKNVICILYALYAFLNQYNFTQTILLSTVGIMYSLIYKFFLVKLVTTLFLSPPCSKIQKYSPTESAKVYDKAVNRKNNVHFSPRQTLEFLSGDLSKADITYDLKRRIVRQYLDVSIPSRLLQLSCLSCSTCLVFCLFFGHLESAYLNA